MKQDAFNKEANVQLGLLKKVVDFKMKFYPRVWAKYEEAVPGTLKLIPPGYAISLLYNLWLRRKWAI